VRGVVNAVLQRTILRILRQVIAACFAVVNGSGEGKMKTKYASRCRNCGHKGKLNVDSEGEITCQKCGAILGARGSPNLDITIMVGWAVMA